MKKFAQKKPLFLLAVALLMLSALAFSLYINEAETAPNHNDYTGRQNTSLSSAPALAPSELIVPVNPSDDTDLHHYQETIYGYSGNGIPLVAHKFARKESNRKILCVFAIHGFEDAFYRDGQALVDIASNIVAHYQQNSSALGSYDLVIVPEANPDGVRQGWTCNGPGRCQLSQEIDMNMDFDYNFRVRTNPRNQTGSEPFSSPEAAALRDLVVKENPDIILDFHGWINCAAGDPALADIFCHHLGLVNKPIHDAIYDGFFIGWAAQSSRAVLVEYPDPFTGTGDYKGKSDQRYDYTSAGFHDLGYTENTLRALEEIIAKQL